MIMVVVLAGVMIGFGMATDAYRQPFFTFFFLSLFVIFGLVKWRWILLVIYPVIWSWTWFELPFATGLSVERLIAIPVAAGFLWELMVKKQKLPRLPVGGTLALGMFLAILLVGLVGNPTSNGLGWLLRLLQKTGWCYLVFYVLSEAKTAELRRFIRLMLISTLVICLGGLAMLINFGTEDRLVYVKEGIWLLPSVGVIGLNVIAPVTLLIFVELAQKHRAIMKVILYTSMILLLSVPSLTLVRRETIFLLPIALFVLFIFSRGFGQRMNVFFLLIFLPIVFLGFVLPNHKAWNYRVETSLSAQAISTEARAAQIKAGLAAFRERPLTGYGLGRSGQIATQFGQDLRLQTPDSSHNSFLTMLIDVGLVGLIGIMALWLSLFSGALRAWRRPLEGYLSTLTATIPAILIYIVGQWAVGDYIRSNPTWTLLALCWAVIWKATQEENEPVPVSAVSQIPVGMGSARR